MLSDVVPNCLMVSRSGSASYMKDDPNPGKQTGGPLQHDVLSLSMAEA